MKENRLFYEYSGILNLCDKHICVHDYMIIPYVYMIVLLVYVPELFDVQATQLSSAYSYALYTLFKWSVSCGGHSTTHK